MLVWQSKDKDFLLDYISQVTNGQWKFTKLDCRYQDPYLTLPDMNNPNHESRRDDAGAASSTDDLLPET
ncbi:hypothetical protein HHI36_015794 [Cryptolaemus montrouzieri]|uniref:Uncharacterized protein n=1 Tax=Cryptolaemus montrouzieri TaxID=559131 RepID=A0ABD2N6N7_9CUCU